MNEELTDGLRALLLEAWAAIRVQHPEVPQVQVELVEEPILDFRGHPCGVAWKPSGLMTPSDALSVARAAWGHGHADVLFAELLVEAAHALSHVVSGMPCSLYQGEHTGAFIVAARAMGLTVPPSSDGVWPEATPTVAAMQQYARERALLCDELRSLRPRLLAREQRERELVAEVSLQAQVHLRDQAVERGPPDERVSVELTQALANCWSAIRARHPEVPGVVLLAAPSPRGRYNVLGHFAPVRWKLRQSGTDEQAPVLIHEVVVVAEHLDRSAEDIFETLLHEAAHALNCARGVRDCSATSQYHNAQFKKTAEELGLACFRVPNYGWAFTELPPETRDHYHEVIASLSGVLAHRRKPALIVVPRGPGSGAQTPGGGDGGDASDTKADSRSRKATCKCPYIIRVSRKVMAATSIRCETCGEAFMLASG